MEEPLLTNPSWPSLVPIPEEKPIVLTAAGLRCIVVTPRPVYSYGMAQELLLITVEQRQTANDAPSCR